MIVNSCDTSNLNGPTASQVPHVQNKVGHKNKGPVLHSFFAYPDSTSPIVVSIIDTLKKSRKINKFVQKFIRKRGYPAWGAARIFMKNNTHIALVPVIRAEEKMVRGIWSISLKQSAGKQLKSSKKAKYKYRYRWIPWGAKLKGNNMPDERTVDIFLLGFEKQIFGGVHIPGMKVKNKIFKPGSSVLTASKNTSGAPDNVMTGHYERRRGRLACTRISVSGGRAYQMPNENWTQIPRQHEDDSVWNCTYNYYFVWVPDISGSGDEDDPESGGPGGSGDGSGRDTGKNKVLTANAFENRIDDSDLNPCMKNELNGLISVSGDNVGAGKIVQDFAIDQINPDPKLGNMNWKLKDGDLPKDVTGQTLIKFNNDTHTVTTIFDSDKFRNATGIAAAQTILHEAVHAYVIYIAFNRKSDPLSAEQKEALLGPDWLTEFNKKGHEFMAAHYRRDIAAALSQFTNHYYDSGFYDDMAWGGLMRYTDEDNNVHEYQFFKNAVPNALERTRIENTVHAEQYGTDIYGNSRRQTGRSDAGC